MEKVLHSIGGTSVYGIVSICLFFAIFVGVLLWTISLKKPYLTAMRELPLENPSGPESHPDMTANPEDRHD
jgi:hypothetical protein